MLVDRYAPYIAPSDKSLQDARNRLKTAIQQTRQLRAAFTERVYGKYRVCLKPPATAEEIIDYIQADPKAASRNLQQESAALKQEKALEKKQAQLLNQDLSKIDASALSVNADNAEQLLYISAGLSLVILPEDNVDQTLVYGYKERAPINPDTGQRVRSISQAAATAGEVILDRARKGAAMRQEWIKKQQQKQKGKKNTTSSEIDILTTPSSMHPVTSAVANVPSDIDSKLIQARSSTNQQGNSERWMTPAIAPTATGTVGAVATTATAAATLGTIPRTAPQAKQVNINFNSSFHLHSFQSPTVSGAIRKPFQTSENDKGTFASISTAQTALPAAAITKGTKGKAVPGISVNISLSLNPTADELGDPEKKTKFRASTAALMTLGLGSSHGMPRASPQQRLRHPHPESIGGRQRASNVASAKKELATLTDPVIRSSPQVQSYLEIALPPLPTPLERRRRKPLPVFDQTYSTPRARKAIQFVLSQFDESCEKPSTNVGHLQRLRTAYQQESNGYGEGSPKSEQSNKVHRERSIDPSLTFAVLAAVGLIDGKDDDKDQKRKMPYQLDRQMEQLKDSAENKLPSFKALHESWEKLSPSKRPKLSETLSGTESDRTGREDRDSARSPLLITIRGGGELLSETKDDNTPDISSSDAKKPKAAGGNNRAENGILPERGSQEMQGINPLRNNNSQVGPNSSTPPSASPSYMRFNPQGQHHLHPSNPNSNYRHPPPFAPFEFAQQLRNASHAMTGLSSHASHPSANTRGMQNYMGAFHNAAHWNFGAANAAGAMATVHSPYAALGSRSSGVYGNDTQDKATHGLMVQEQQHAAAARAVAAHQQSVSQRAFLRGAANPGFSAPSPPMQPARDSNSKPVSTHLASSSAPLSDNQYHSHVDHQSIRSKKETQASINHVGAAKLGGEHKNQGSSLQQKVDHNPFLQEKTKQPDMVKALSQDECSGVSAVKSSNGAAGQSHEPEIREGRKGPGLLFYLPKSAHSLSSEEAKLVQAGRLHELVTHKVASGEQFNAPALLEYLVAVGTAVPIPKAFVANALKDRLNTPTFKSFISASGMNVPREVRYFWHF